MPPAKTIKQAKAAFKARDETPITEREQKQLERSLQLDRRAWALREREKNRADAAKKRLAQEKAQKDEERRLGTQVRRDRFGFKSSQFHLGAFFRKPGMAVGNDPIVEESGRESAVVEAQAAQPDEQRERASFVCENTTGNEDEWDDEFGFEDVDDESLLEALQSPEAVRTSKPEPETKPPNPPPDATATASMPAPPRPPSMTTTKPPAPALANAPTEPDLEWQDFLSSSTQIARELDSHPPSPENPQTPQPAAKEPPRNGSFSSDSFDLTEDDIEKLDPTPSATVAKRNEERKRMPPPPLPLPFARSVNSMQGLERKDGGLMVLLKGGRRRK